MRARATFLAVAAALLGSAGWWLLRVDASGSVAPAVAAEVPAEGPASPGADGPRPDAFGVLRATTAAEVREVLRRTAAASAADRPALRDAALQAADPLVAGNAIKALGRLKSFSGDAALLALIADPRLRVRQDAVQACGLDGRAAAIPHLERALATGEATLRPLILDALGRIGGPAARTLLEGVAMDPGATATDRAFARSALRRLPS